MQLLSIHPAGDERLARELLALQRAAYAVEAGLIGDSRIPPLHEDLASLCAAPLTWLGAFDEGSLVGAVAWTETPDLVDLDRLIVAPSAHRRGIGRALVEAALRHAGSRRTIVSTGKGNVPARTLYERLGFRWLQDAEVLPGLWVSRFAREPAERSSVHPPREPGAAACAPRHRRTR